MIKYNIIKLYIIKNEKSISKYDFLYVIMGQILIKKDEIDDSN